MGPSTRTEPVMSVHSHQMPTHHPIHPIPHPIPHAIVAPINIAPPPVSPAVIAPAPVAPTPPAPVVQVKAVNPAVTATTAQIPHASPSTSPPATASQDDDDLAGNQFI